MPKPSLELVLADRLEHFHVQDRINEIVEHLHLSVQATDTLFPWIQEHLQYIQNLHFKTEIPKSDILESLSVSLAFLYISFKSEWLLLNHLINYSEAQEIKPDDCLIAKAFLISKLIEMLEDLADREVIAQRWEQIVPRLGPAHQMS